MNIWFSETGANVVLSAAFEKESQELTARRGTLALYHGEREPVRKRSRPRWGFSQWRERE